ncbi:hypothetical protein JCM8202v2_004763 [Rhodotorula sphaerocarpa]
MDHPIHSSTLFALAPVSAYALAPSVPADLPAVVLVATTMLAPSSEAQRGVLSAALVFLTLAVGSTTSLVLSNATLSETFSSARDILGGLTLYALVTTLVPLAGIACISLATSLETPASFTSICAAGLCFALTGAIYERLSGIGRVGWWVRAAGLGQGSAFVDAVTAAGGPVLVDALIGACALAVVQIVWVSLVALRSNGNQAVVDLLAEDVEEVVATPERRDPVGQWRKPVGFLASVAAAGIIAPLVLASHVELVHPAPNDPGWTPPDLEAWLHESKVVASKGARILSWSEGAVTLSKGGTLREGGTAWESLGEEEQDLLRRVGAVSDLYRVFILATYLVPVPAGPERHRLLNVATLVGPRSPDTHADRANIVFSTTKHHPVPFVESYTHAVRDWPEVGSVRGAVPLARVALPPDRHTPARHLTPPENLSLSAAIWQDAAFPSLLSTFASVAVRVSDIPRSSGGPQLLLNPSASPPSLPGLAALSLAQARARAIEQGAFVLRCDRPALGGVGGPGSVLIDPSGRVRVWTGPAGAAGGSFEAEVRPEEARAGSRSGGAGRGWARIGRNEVGDWTGAEERFFVLLAAVLFLVRGIEGGEAARRLGDMQWRTLAVSSRARLHEGLAGWASRIRRSLPATGREQERAPLIAAEVDGRLVEVGQ